MTKESELRINRLEDIVVKHMEKVEENACKFTNLLDDIKEEIHKANSNIDKLNSSHELRLVETKSEIYNTVFNRVINKEEYNRETKKTKEALGELKKELGGKVDKSSVRLIWIVFTSFIAVTAWFYKK